MADWDNIIDIEDVSKKEIFVIGCYPIDEERQSLLEKQIDILKRHTNIPILVVSHCPVSETVQSSVDYLLYDRENRLGTDVAFTFNQFYDNGDVMLMLKIPASNYHTAAILTNMKNALRFCDGRYGIIHYVESDFFFYIEKYLASSRECFDNGKKFFGFFSDSDNYIDGGLMSFDVDWMNEKMPKDFTWDDYKKIDHYMKRDDEDPGQLIFEPWFYNYFVKFDMIKDAEILSNRKEYVIINNAFARVNGDRLLVSETEDNALVLFATRGMSSRSNKRKICKLIDRSSNIILMECEIAQMQTVWVVTDKKDSIVDLYMNDSLVDSVTIEKDYVYNDTVFLFRSGVMKCIDWYGDMREDPHGYEAKFGLRKKNKPKEDRIDDIVINFVKGAKVEIIGEGDLTYHVDFIDRDTGMAVHSDDLKVNHWIVTNRKYFTNWLIKITCMGKTLFEYKSDLTDRRIFISFESKSLGDTIAWMPYVEEFRKKHDCKIILSMFWSGLFEKEYPEIEYVTPGSVVDNIYAHYRVGCWDNDFDKNKYDWRITPIQKIATDILGLEYKEIVPKMTVLDSERVIDGKYVCLGIHSTAQAKYWNYYGGWQEVVDYLNDRDYKVIFISKESGEYMGNLPPHGIVDKSGDKPIDERIIDLKYADMFIGISSGLTWLSWAVGTPSVMISGCSLPTNEFSTNVERIFHKDGCNGCLNDDEIIFDRGNWNWCPKNKNFECSRNITPKMVIGSIEKIIGGCEK